MEPPCSVSLSNPPDMAEELQGLVAAYWPFRDVLDPDDSEYAPRGASCVKISDALGRIREASSGLYAFGGSDCDLPALPGLVVRDAGVIPLPLAESFARCLLDRCTQVDQCWEVPADQVWMKNPEWNHKMGDLGAAVGEKLGFQDALLDVILSKLVVLGPGGRLDKRENDVEEEDVVATLVVQLPSLHEGGELVVYDDEDAAKKYTFDFWKSTGTAAFKPSYAVYVAGAEYEVTEVKSGYRVELVYSIRLPPDETAGVENRSRRFVQKMLKDAVAEFGGTNEAFALLLKSKYGGFEAFEARGEERLAGVDHARYQALLKANNLAPRDKRLKFYISKLRHTASVVKDPGRDGTVLCRSYPRIQPKGNGVVGAWWRIKEKFEATVWLSAKDGIVPDWDSDNAADSTLDWTSQLNFLNPDHVSPRGMWEEHACCKISDAGQSIEYEAYALVGWPIAVDLENVLKFIGENAALETVLADVPVSAAKLREFMNMASGQQQENNDASDTIVSQYTTFCRNLCKAITATGDVELAWLFFIRYFDRVKRKRLLAHSLGELLEAVGWIAVHEPITSAINRMSPFEVMEFALEMTEYVSDEDTVSTMRLLAVSKAQQIPVLALAASRSIGQLWKAAARFKDKSLFPVIESLFQRMEADALGPVVGLIAQTVNTGASAEERAVLSSLVSRRRRWLQDKVSRLKSWAMPEAEFPGHAGVEAFLRGPKASFVISGFSDIMGAEKFIKYHQSQPKQGVSYIMTAHGSGMNAIVIVTKTREHHHQSKHELDELTAELTRLAQVCPPASAGVDISGYKRPRTETSSDEPSGSKQRREGMSEGFSRPSGSLMQANGMPASDDNVPPSA